MSNTRKRRKPLTASVRRGLENIAAFCEVNAFEGSELYPNGERQLAKDTDAALAWLGSLLSSDSSGEKR